MTIERIIKGALFGVSLLWFAVAYHAGFNFFGFGWAVIGTVLFICAATL